MFLRMLHFKPSTLSFCFSLSFSCCVLSFLTRGVYPQIALRYRILHYQAPVGAVGTFWSECTNTFPLHHPVKRSIRCVWRHRCYIRVGGTFGSKYANTVLFVFAVWAMTGRTEDKQSLKVCLRSEVHLRRFL